MSASSATAQINDSINDIITSRLRRNVEILALGVPTHNRKGTINTHRIDIIKKRFRKTCCFSKPF
ncbi:hypothetical protein ACE193_08215 [Bernardetia sp. OM2101]|uniref:hypothetical protein n=1 Tax=Bernardetia sp. OM2101 TaxID=3344876 RepID=UPI0035CFCF19